MFLILNYCLWFNEIKWSKILELLKSCSDYLWRTATAFGNQLRLKGKIIRHEVFYFGKI